ncbi:YcjX family protein [Octadecabacter sp. 1_MG-2023]|uniref:YcjX family protein n=1 Tax=unclassified Octadecabacter TaxID=196158 RepID=UPI0026E41C28|nr:YcjX family protein [Octadecabacter sp. 1_MG-2023]MDO6734065.1 YcjX family protein [Octadecabacter sp. 1_MG-2023]
MVIADITDRLTAPFGDQVIRLGVTGLSRAGKTVFITSLVANLLNRGRMTQFQAATSGAIKAAYLQPQPDDTIPRFDYENHLAALTAKEPHWPKGTERISELRLSMKVQPTGLLGSFQGPRTVHLDIVDYPGEWLLDLSLMDKDFATWSAEALGRVTGRPAGEGFTETLAGCDPSEGFEEPQAQDIAAAYTAHLTAAREAGFSDCTPGRFLMPGDLEGSPVLTFAPLPLVNNPSRKSLWREFERRYDSYKRNVVRPFFRDHFARLDRQVVLVDVLGAIHAGPQAVEDMRGAMADILSAFRPGQNSFLTRLFQGRRIDKILFAATKADHLHHQQHPQLTAITQALLRDAKDRAEFSGATTQAMSIAALRTTVEDTRNHNGAALGVVRGHLLGSDKHAAFYPGALPDDPAHLLGPARAGAEKWLNADYQVMSFAPAPLTLNPGDGPPHIRLDKAVQFLLGDKL